MPPRPDSLRSVLVALVLLAASVLPAAAQEPTVYVDVSTNLPEATLYADSVRVGPVRGEAVRAVPAGTQALRLVPPDDLSWSVQPVAASVVRAEAGDTLRVAMSFPYHYSVRSMPYGAAVYAETPTGRRRLGTTPLVHVQPTPLEGTLLVEEPAYAPQRFTPGQDVWNEVDAVLTPTAPTPLATHEVAWSPPSRRMRWLDYASLGLALGAGVLTVHYKFKADRLYDRYTETTDPSLRPDIDTYDTRAAVSLGVMQASVGLFAVRLVLRD